MRLLRGDTLTARAGRGTVWTIGNIAASNFLRLGSNLILTRLLFPEAFGMMALVQIFITGLAMFSDLGTHAAIIQNSRSNEPAFLNTAWTLQVIRGFVLWGLACAIALPVATFYEEPMLAALLPVAGLTALIAGFTPTRVPTANRDLQLGRITLIDLIAQAVGIVAMVILAWALQSVWALVFGSLIGAVFKQILLMTALPGHRNRLQIDRSCLKELVNFGKWIFLSTMAGFLVNNADRAILGKFITLEMLGIYSIGYLMASLPLKLGRPLADKIIFPLYKQRPPWESAENQRKIFRVRWLLTGALMAVSLVLAISGDALIRFLYDPRYALAGPILVLMVISQMPVMIASSYGKILLAAGDSRRYMMRITSIALVQTIFLVIFIPSFGIIGAIMAPAVGAIVTYPVLVTAVHRYKGWDARHDLFYAVLAMMVAGLALWINLDSILVLWAFSVNP